MAKRHSNHSHRSQKRSAYTRKEHEPVPTNVSSGMCDPYLAKEFWFGRRNTLDTFLRGILHVTLSISHIKYHKSNIKHKIMANQAQRLKPLRLLLFLCPIIAKNADLFA
jgi:hypothetical protein